MQFTKMKNWKSRVIGYDTVLHQMYQPPLPKVHKQKNLAVSIFAATFTRSLLMF